jgi:proteic killer suppression protein
MWAVIESFWHRGLRELFETGRSARVRADLQRRTLVRLAAIDSAAALEALRQPGFDFHALRGRPRRYSIHVNGPWCVTFEWRDGRALRVDLEQYH